MKISLLIEQAESLFGLGVEVIPPSSKFPGEHKSDLCTVKTL